MGWRMATVVGPDIPGASSPAFFWGFWDWCGRLDLRSISCAFARILVGGLLVDGSHYGQRAGDATCHEAKRRQSSMAQRGPAH